MKKSTLLFVIFIAIATYALCQNSNEFCPWYSRLLNPQFDFIETQKMMSRYIESTPDSIVRKDQKYFNRAAYFLGPRVTNSDTGGIRSIDYYNKVMVETIMANPICSGNNNNANWSYIGPYLNTHEIGIVTAVYSDTNTPNIIYAGKFFSCCWIFSGFFLFL